ncbi:hypothetical protein JCM3766R1_002402 [Sporobolomyces carnicolor]
MLSTKAGSASSPAATLSRSSGPPPSAPGSGFKRIGPVSTSTSTSSSSGRAPPAGPASSANAVPTGPKAWRSIQAPSATLTATGTPSFSASASPAPSSTTDALPAVAPRSESPAPVRPPSPAPPPPPPPSDPVSAVSAPPTPPPPSAPSGPTPATKHMHKEREMRQAQIELKRRTVALARYLPRSVGGLLVNVHGITSAMTQSPGLEIEHEIAKCRKARLTSLDDHVSKLLLLRKSEYDLQSARADADVARERTRLASGESGNLEASGLISIGTGGGGSGY